MVNSDTIFIRVNNPVCPNTGTALIIQLVLVTNNTDIRLSIIFAVLIQKHGKWSDLSPTGTIVAVNMNPNGCKEFSNDILMFPAGWSHIVNLAVNQFSTFPIRQSINIINSIGSFPW